MNGRARNVFIVGCIVSMAMLAAGAGLVSAGQSGFSVGQDAYVVGKVTLSKSDAYIGDTIYITGDGQLPNAVLDVYMGGIYEGDDEIYLAKLGVVTSDGDGNWSHTFTVPSTCTKESDDSTVAVFPAYWPVGSMTIGPDTAVYSSWTDPDLLVYGPPPATTEAASYDSETYSSSTLPATGSFTTIIGMGLIAAGILCFCTTRIAYNRSKPGGSG